MKAVASALLILGLAAATASAGERPWDECANCPPPRQYDSQEVVKTTKDIDRSRTINTTTVVPVSRKVEETNHLVIHRNTIRNVGVIRHNHTIIEKETRYVRRVPAETVVEFVTRKYRVVERPATVSIPVPNRPVKTCKRSKRAGHYGSCAPLRVRG